ncbi:MAG: hypothetical protein QME45_06635 [Clostridiales bacterium]|nr:hypothetical protein [Clostridiales bacterium]
MDIPWCATYIANLAYKIAGEKAPGKWKNILEGRSPKFHFEFPGSTHGFRIASDIEETLEYEIHNTTETSHSGTGSLKIVAKPLMGGKELRVFYKTYYRPKDFHDSRYDPSFSPVLYPGQRVTAGVMVPQDTGYGVLACLYVKDGNTGNIIEGKKVDLSLGNWNELSFNIPHLDGACLEEAGVKFIPKDGWNVTLVAYIDDMDFRGEPDYAIDFTKERMEVWNGLHLEVSQFTYLKGIWRIENGELSGSCCDFGEAYTGGNKWKDYTFEATIKPQVGEYHGINFRVQGAIRSYSVGLIPSNKLALSKNENGYRILEKVDFPWHCGGEYTLKVEAKGPSIKVMDGDKVLIEYEDSDKPYLTGQVGACIQKGSHCHYKDFKIGKIK